MKRHNIFRHVRLIMIYPSAVSLAINDYFLPTGNLSIYKKILTRVSHSEVWTSLLCEIYEQLSLTSDLSCFMAAAIKIALCAMCISISHAIAPYLLIKQEHAFEVKV